MMDGFKEVSFKGKKDYLFSLEVRQNRADCLSVMGLAREVAAFYGLGFKMPVAKVDFPAETRFGIKVEAKNQVKRALAVEIIGLKNKQSPAWLKEFLAFYDINSINLLVDLSNYAMIVTGYPSHLLDKDKMAGSLCWSLNKNFKEIATLNDKVKLSGGEVIIKDEKNVLGLAGIVGGKIAAIDKNSRNLIAEMAIYDRVSIRRDSRKLKISTEASLRLEKDLDPEGLDFAIRFLISLILKEAGGKIVAKPFSFYPKKQSSPRIKFDPKLASVFSGINIPEARALKILKALRFKVLKSKNAWQVVPPPDRKDIVIPEDVVEEVVRIFGFEKIPSDQTPAFPVVKVITPKTIDVSEKTRDILTCLGFDEILSWTLTKKDVNLATNYQDWENISTQNSVNEEFPDLRQSIAPSLLFQLAEYKKKNIEKISIFEIGRVFGKKGQSFLEQDSLGILIKKEKGRAVQDLRKAIEVLLRSLGLNAIDYALAETKPRIANPFSCWNVFVREKPVGMLYKINSSEKENIAFAEISISKISCLLQEFSLNPAVELTQKLVILDANVELGKDENILKFLKSVESKIPKDNLWSLEIKDRFPLKNRVRYTVKVSYTGLSDKLAKETHGKVFNLTKAS
jgi:phenylalanyl-tRNA synthetase beta chain